MKNLRQAAQCVFVAAIGIQIPVETLTSIIEADAEYWAKEDSYLADDADGLDTYPREVLLEQFGKMQFGLEWPCYGSSDSEKTKFYAMLEAYVIKQIGVT